jgi:hypothetical protein
MSSTEHHPQAPDLVSLVTVGFFCEQESHNVAFCVSGGNKQRGIAELRIKVKAPAMGEGMPRVNYRGIMHTLTV